MNLFQCLLKYQPLEEVKGNLSNPKLLEIIKRYVPDATDDSKISWCSLILIQALSENGYDIKGASLAARSWLNVGEQTNEPIPKDSIVVLWRNRIKSWEGHVGIYAGKGSKPNTILVYGGNQNDKIGYAEFSTARVLGYRHINKK